MTSWVESFTLSIRKVANSKLQNKIKLTWKVLKYYNENDYSSKTTIFLMTSWVILESIINNKK